MRATVYVECRRRNSPGRHSFHLAEHFVEVIVAGETGGDRDREIDEFVPTINRFARSKRRRQISSAIDAPATSEIVGRATAA